MYSRERLRRVPFKNLLWYSFAYSRERLRRVPFKKSPVIFVFQSSSSHHHHHHHHLIIIIISSSSHHHHLLIIISPSSSSSSFPSLSPAFLFFSSFPSLSPAFLFFSNLAQPSSHEKRARCNPSQGKCVSSVKNWGFFPIFAFFFGRVHPSLGKRGSSVKNWGFLCDFFWSGAPLSGKTRVECQKLGFFCVFGGPETVLKTVLTIRFASYGRFFKRGKMSENRQKTSKTGGFWRFFRVRSNPLRESGCRVSKIGVFLRFWCARICAHDSFCLIRPCPDPVPRWKEVVSD